MDLEDLKAVSGEKLSSDDIDKQDLEAHSSQKPIEKPEEGEIGVEDLMDEFDLDTVRSPKEDDITETDFIEENMMIEKNFEKKRDENYIMYKQNFNIPQAPELPTVDHSSKITKEKEEVEGEDDERIVLSGKGSEKYKDADFFKEEIQRAISKCVCTYKLTKKSYYLQKWYSCFQCNLVGGLGCCESCANNCHKGHTGIRENEKNSPCRAYCDCGATLPSCVSMNKEFESIVESFPIVDQDYSGPGIYYFKNGDTYEGAWENGKMHGKGKLTCKRGVFSSFEGDFVENVIQGIGRFEFFTGLSFEGEVAEGKQNGKGISYNGADMVYNGFWKNGVFDGIGTRYYPTNAYQSEKKTTKNEEKEEKLSISYIGSWKKGKKCGKGKSFYRDGKKRYEGTFFKDLYHGHGISYDFKSGEMNYEGSWKNGKMHGNGKCNLGKNRYEGEFKENKFDGRGVYYHEDGSPWYMGAWRTGKRHGWGECLEKVRGNENLKWRYVGSYRDDKQHGDGKLYLGDFLHFDGRYCKGLKDGYGVQYFQNGEKYEGSFRSGKKHGFGIYYFSDGEKMFRGQYYENKFHGPGQCWYVEEVEDEEGKEKKKKRGAYFDGYFRDNRKHGKGTLYYSYDQKKVHYRGSWEDDMREGQGENFWEDGNSYKGEWKKNVQNGKGKYSLADGVSFSQGEWMNGELNGHGIRVYKNGEKFIGKFLDGKRHGRGKLFFASGELFYSGDWVAGKKEGFGKVFNDGKCFYEGYLKNDRKEGLGTFYYPDGRVFYDGSYKHNKKDGQGECFFKDGSYYSGGWREGQKCGKGKFIFRNKKKIHDGDWNDNKEHGVIALSHQNPFSDEGEVTFVAKKVYFKGEVVRNIPPKVLEEMKEKEMNQVSTTSTSMMKKELYVLDYSLRYISSEYESHKKDRDFIISLLEENGEELQYVHETQKLDFEIVRAAVKKYPHTILYADEQFLKDRNLVMDIVQVNGECVFFVDPKYLEDPDLEVIRLAVQQNGMILEHLSQANLQEKHPEIISEAVNQNGLALKYCLYQNYLRSEQDYEYYISNIVLVAVKNNPFAIRYFQPSTAYKSDGVNNVICEAFARLNAMIHESFSSSSSRINKKTLKTWIEDFFESLMFSQIGWRNWMDGNLSKKLAASVSNRYILELRDKVKKQLFSSSEYFTKASSYLSGEDKLGVSFEKLIQKILDRVFDVHQIAVSDNINTNQIFLGCVFNDYLSKTMFRRTSSPGIKKREILSKSFRRSFGKNTSSKKSYVSEEEKEEEEPSFEDYLDKYGAGGCGKSSTKNALLSPVTVGGEKKNKKVMKKLNIYGYGVIFEKTSSIIRKKYQRVFYGSFKNGYRYGEGKEYSKKGKLSFEGSFLNGVKEGKGILYEDFRKHSIVRYEGMYKNNKKNGRGEMHDPKTGKVSRGYWKEDILDRSSVFSFSCMILEYSDYEEHLQNSAILGSGAYGIVYKVRSDVFPSDLKIGKDREFVAVKIMKCATRMEVGFLLRITKRGIGLCCSLESENIISVYGIIQGMFEVGYVMELCSTDVSKVIEASNHTMSIIEKTAILLGTAKGMSDLHEKLVMHRDLKWPNVMISSDNVVKITDFDTLKEDERIWRVQSIAGSSHIGTPGFLAPEVFNGRKYTLSCDVFAFGLMIYSLLWEIPVPHATQYQCSCGHLLENIIQAKLLDYHIANCNLRPLIAKSEIDRFPMFLMDLMISCWDPDPLKRPSFPDVVHLFESEAKKEKCYAVLLLQFPKLKNNDKRSKKKSVINDQIMLLVQPRITKIIEWIEMKFRGSKVLHLYNKKSGEELVEDDQIFRMIQEEDGKHVIEVDLDCMLLDSNSLRSGISSSSLSSVSSPIGGLPNSFGMASAKKEVVMLKKELGEVKEKFAREEKNSKEKYDALFQKCCDLEDENQRLKKLLKVEDGVQEELE